MATPNEEGFMQKHGVVSYSYYTMPLYSQKLSIQFLCLLRYELYKWRNAYRTQAPLITIFLNFLR